MYFVKRKTQNVKRKTQNVKRKTKGFLPKALNLNNDYSCYLLLIIRLNKI